jgi:hypothetical protein
MCLLNWIIVRYHRTIRCVICYNRFGVRMASLSGDQDSLPAGVTLQSPHAKERSPCSRLSRYREYMLTTEKTGTIH